MAKVNMLIKKGYLLAGVIMAANMFIVNEVKATDEENNDNILNTNEKNKNSSISHILDTASEFILLWENTINLAVGFVFSSVNNYFRWWDYNAGSYRKLGCFGWRSGRFLKDYLQFEVNLNVGRGILWLIPGAYNFILFCFYTKEALDPLYTACIIGSRILQLIDGEYKKTDLTVFFLVFLLQGFVSMPLAIHISNFSIAISLDSIFWASVGKFLSVGKNLPTVNGYEELEQNEEKDENQFQLIDIKDNTEGNDNKSSSEEEREEDKIE